MFRRFALPVALATALLLTACATGPTGPGALAPQSSTETTDASAGATEQGTTEGASESAAAGADAFSSASASLNAGEPGLPQGSGASIDDVLRLGAVATWVEAPDVFAISLPATSDCWASAGEPVAVDGSVAVSFMQEGECAMADAARTYTLPMPAGVDTSEAVEVAVEGLDLQFTLALPAP
ncbi:hypothetical protein [Agrococcus beijingensis]|uniref:hypothetical protein n=1 Tax=Agrococcus beijingensis TaxID=3068634 RepID=UPI00274186E2|nr:hypothetical protein [Agrococcus sp. REN33]